MADDVASSKPSGPSVNKTSSYPPITGAKKEFVEVAIERGYTSASKIEALRSELGAKGIAVTPEELPGLLVTHGILTQEQSRSCERGMRGNAVIAGFEILEKVGQGGMGAVFRARQVSMDRVVALKILPPKLAQDPVFKQRFLNEARVCAKLSHLNIINGIDCGEQAGYTFFAMEYVDGRTVKQIQKEKGRFTPPEALGIVRQIVDGLIYARRMNLVHRDIKPDNIMLTSANVAKLCDLGLAKQTESAEEASMTTAGMAVGTPHYISPEQARGEKTVDHRSDIYSLGASFYHMIVGKPLFEAPTSAVIMALHLTETAKGVCELNPLASEGYGQVIAKMLAKAPADRYATPEELAEDLDTIKNNGSPKAADFTGRSSCQMPPSLVLQSVRKGVRTTGPQKPIDGLAGRKTSGNAPIAKKPSWLPMAAAGAVLAIGGGIFVATRAPKDSGDDTKKAGAPVVAAAKDKAPAPKADVPSDKSAQIMPPPRAKDPQGSAATETVPPTDVKVTEPIASNATKGPPPAFWFYLTGDKKKPRKWEQIDATTWRESYPSGEPVTFKVVGRDDKGGKRGTIARKHPEGQWEVMIPDAGSDMMFYFRPIAGAPWIELGKVNVTPFEPESVAEAPVAVEAPPKEIARPEVHTTSDMVYARFLQELATRAENKDLTKLQTEMKELAGKPEYKDAKEDIKKEMADLAGAIQFEQASLQAMATAKRDVPLNEEKYHAKKGKVIDYSPGRGLAVEVNKVAFQLPATALPPEDVVSFAPDKTPLSKARYMTARGKHPAALALLSDLPAEEKTRWERKLQLLISGEKELVAEAFFKNMAKVADAKSWKTLLEMIADFEKNHADTASAKENGEKIKAWKTQAEDTLAALDVKRRFHTRAVKELGDGYFEVSYDFSTELQLKDFECTHGDLSVSDGRMLLPSGGGEYSLVRLLAPIEKLRSISVNMAPTDGDGHRIRVTFLAPGGTTTTRDPSVILRPGMKRIILENLMGTGAIDISAPDVVKENQFVGVASPDGPIKWTFNGELVGASELPDRVLNGHVAFACNNGNLAIRKLTIVFKPTTAWLKEK